MTNQHLKLLLLLWPIIGFFSQVEAQEINDGPYLSYYGDSILCRNVVQGKLNKWSVALKDKSKVLVKVRFPEKPEFDFDVPLKTAIKVEKSTFPQPEKLFFVSDIEGEFDGFRRLLITGGVIDKSYRWTFGKGHLVICGDLFDRGKQVPEAMWLLYKLEALAARAGGYVHVILGNHDIMNLSGDLRYLAKKYPESASIMGVNYMELYAENTELGRWLRSKNTIEKIGENLCMHAGVAPVINDMKLTVEEINQRCRPFYDKAKVLKGVGDPKVDAFYTGSTSLFWYRGYFSEPKASEAEVDTTLNLFGVKRIVVGHTIVPENVGFYYQGKVLGLDVNGHAGQYEAAFYSNGKWFKLKADGERMAIK